MGCGEARKVGFTEGKEGKQPLVAIMVQPVGGAQSWRAGFCSRLGTDTGFVQGPAQNFCSRPRSVQKGGPLPAPGSLWVASLFHMFP